MRKWFWLVLGIVVLVGCGENTKTNKVLKASNYQANSKMEQSKNICKVCSTICANCFDKNDKKLSITSPKKVYKNYGKYCHGFIKSKKSHSANTEIRFISYGRLDSKIDSLNSFTIKKANYNDICIRGTNPTAYYQFDAYSKTKQEIFVNSLSSLPVNNIVFFLAKGWEHKEIFYTPLSFKEVTKNNDFLYIGFKIKSNNQKKGVIKINSQVLKNQPINHHSKYNNIGFIKISKNHSYLKGKNEVILSIQEIIRHTKNTLDKKGKVVTKRVTEPDPSGYVIKEMKIKL